MSVVAASIMLGGIAGATVFGSAGRGLYAVLAFGTVTLLYLVTEELLTEPTSSPTPRC